jgi:hypothetical protein
VGALAEVTSYGGWKHLEWTLCAGALNSAGLQAVVVPLPLPRGSIRNMCSFGCAVKMNSFFLPPRQASAVVTARLR